MPRGRHKNSLFRFFSPIKYGLRTLRRQNDVIFSKELTIRGVKNADFDSFAIAVKLIESRKYPFEKMHTHSFAMGDLERAIQTLAGRVNGEQAVCVSLDPSL